VPGLPTDGSFHPDKCQFCEEPRDYLIAQLEEFRDWSAISADGLDGTPLRLEIESFQSLPGEEQKRLVRKVQMTMEAPTDPRSPW